jgi:hypothetical protein
MGGPGVEWRCAERAQASDQPVLMATFFGCASGFFGTKIERTPSFKFACTFSPSMPSGSVKARVKLPYERS